jgi:hypothetical protein
MVGYVSAERWARDSCARVKTSVHAASVSLTNLSIDNSQLEIIVLIVLIFIPSRYVAVIPSYYITASLCPSILLSCCPSHPRPISVQSPNQS